jgi:glycosyltransferase involved in cell wall biosynthesis
MFESRDNPLVSVIMPAYNVEKYVSQSIKSVFAQTYKNIELIVIDDGSTDFTNQVIKEVIQESGSNARVISTENGGACRAKNLAMKSANGEYLAFLDSDDFWLPEKIEIQVKYLLENLNAIGVGCGYEKFLDKSKKKTKVINFSWDKKTIFKWMVIENQGPGLNSTLMLRAQILKEIGGFDEKLGSMADDLDLAWRLHLKGEIITTPICLASIRIWHGQIHKNISNMAQALSYVYIKHLTSDPRSLGLALGNLNVWYGVKMLLKLKIFLGLGAIFKGVAMSRLRSITLPIKLLLKSSKLK